MISRWFVHHMVADIMVVMAEYLGHKMDGREAARVMIYMAMTCHMDQDFHNEFRKQLAIKSQDALDWWDVYYNEFEVINETKTAMPVAGSYELANQVKEIINDIGKGNRG